MLLEEESPGGRTPVIILRDRDNLVHWNVYGLNTGEFQCIEPQKFGFRVELHSQNKAFGSNT